MRLSTLLVSGALALGATPAMAAGLVDGSFEAQGAASTSSYCYFGQSAGGNAACTSSPWTGTSGLQKDDNGPWPGINTTDGDYYGFVQGNGRLEQTFTAEQTGLFNLSWTDAGRRFNGGYDGDQTYIVLLEEISTIAEVVGDLLYSGGTTSGSTSFTGRTSSLFSLTGGNTYKLTFQGLASTDQTAFIDNVAINAVPEPATWLMMILGFGFIGSAMRRRKGESQAAIAA